MIGLREVQRLAYERSAPEQMIERDYILTWVMLAAARDRELKRLIAKGGTTLKKLYFADWRYSEPRDLYDVWRLLDEHANEMDAQRLRTTFEAKCAHRGLTASSAVILSAERVTKYRTAWERRLSEQVPDLPALDAVVRETRRRLREFFG